MSTEVAVQQRPEVDITLQRERLPELVEVGDTEGLHRVAHAADLYRLHQKAMGHAEEANRAGRLKIEAEAGIGVIDIRAVNFFNHRHEPLRINGDPVAPTKRSLYRKLGYADLQGLLEEALTSVVTSGEQVTTSRVYKEATSLGAGRWSVEPFVAALDGAKKEGRSLAAIFQEAGLQRRDMNSLRQCRTVRWEVGIALARALRLDEASLRPLCVRQTTLSRSEQLRRARQYAIRRQDAKRLATWKARDDRVRERGGKVAEMYALARRAEQMASGARDGLQTKEAKAELDSAVIDLMEAAAKLDRAGALG